MGILKVFRIVSDGCGGWGEDLGSSARSITGVGVGPLAIQEAEASQAAHPCPAQASPGSPSPSSGLLCLQCLLPLPPPPHPPLLGTIWKLLRM